MSTRKPLLKRLVPLLVVLAALTVAACGLIARHLTDHRFRPAPTPTPSGSPPAGAAGPVGFPTACRSEAFCDRDVDSICTIIFVAEAVGTNPAQIREGVAGETLWGLTAADFAACPQYLGYLTPLP